MFSVTSDLGLNRGSTSLRPNPSQKVSSHTWVDRKVRPLSSVLCRESYIGLGEGTEEVEVL